MQGTPLQQPIRHAMHCLQSFLSYFGDFSKPSNVRLALYASIVAVIMAMMAGVEVFYNAVILEGRKPRLSLPLIYNYKKSKVCVTIPVTSRKQAWKKLEDSFLYQRALMSLSKTCEQGRYSYSVYVGYDVGDPFFDNPETLSSLHKWMGVNMPFASLEALPFENRQRKPGPAMNFLSRQAYNDGCEFIYRINDDTEFVTPWTSALIGALRNFSPPLRGVVGPTCNQGNTAILTHDFVHRGHLDIFPTHYPEELTDWWLDDWISAVYGEQNTRKLPEVVVVHHVLDTRYEVKWGSERLLKSLVEEGRRRIEGVRGNDGVSSWPSWAYWSILTNLSHPLPEINV